MWITVTVACKCYFPILDLEKFITAEITLKIIQFVQDH